MGYSLCSYGDRESLSIFHAVTWAIRVCLITRSTISMSGMVWNDCAAIRATASTASFAWAVLSNLWTPVSVMTKATSFGTLYQNSRILILLILLSLKILAISLSP